MKVLIVNQHPHDRLGGSEIQCDIIANQLTQFGHQVSYLAINGEKDFYNTIYKVIPKENINLFSLFQVFRTEQPDIIYWRYEKHKLLLASIMANILNLKIVFAVSSIKDARVWYRSESLSNIPHSRADNIFPIDIIRHFVNYFRSLLTDFIRLINSIAIPLFIDGVICVNSNEAKNIPSRNKIVVYDSMDTDYIKFYWKNPYVVWVANLKNIKNPEKFYQLAKEMQYENIDFLMIGKIQDKKYEYLANEHNKLQNFYFLGPKSPLEVNGILRDALFLVHTCSPEGFGNNFIQAWLQGKPTVSLYFDPDGIIERERIGFFSKNFTNFVKQTGFLIENNSKRERMGEIAYQYAHKNHNPQVNVKRLETFLCSIIKEN